MIEFLEKRLAELRKNYRETGLADYLIRSRECMLILNKLKETEKENVN